LQSSPAVESHFDFLERLGAMISPEEIARDLATSGKKHSERKLCTLVDAPSGRSQWQLESVPYYNSEQKWAHDML
jgi:hypothetical protein